MDILAATPHAEEIADRGRAIAAAIADENFDLIVTGLQSDDFGAAQTGVLLAEILGLPHATIIIGIEKTDSGLHLKRELEAAGVKEDELKTLEAEIRKQVAEAADFAEQTPEPDPAELYTEVLVETY